MRIKIEKIAVDPQATSHGFSNEDFVVAARDLKPGESFEFPGFGPYQRNALSVLQYAYGRTYTSRKTSQTTARVFRVS